MDDRIEKSKEGTVFGFIKYIESLPYNGLISRILNHMKDIRDRLNGHGLNPLMWF